MYLLDAPRPIAVPGSPHFKTTFGRVPTVFAQNLLEINIHFNFLSTKENFGKKVIAKS